jgi:hypothetical protein
VTPHTSLLCDGAIVRALEDFARRELRGEHPWLSISAGPLPGVCAELARVRPDTEAYRSLLADVLDSPATEGWASLGLWRLIAYAGPAELREERAVRERFLVRLRECLGDPRRIRPRYLADAVEEGLIRQHEPKGGVLWRLVPIRPADLVDRTPPEPGAEPPVTDLAAGGYRDLATIHGHRLYARLRPEGGYVAMLAGPEGTLSTEDASADEVFAEAESLTDLLRTVARRIGFHGAADWTHRDLNPYFPNSLPDWWPR